MLASLVYRISKAARVAVTASCLLAAGLSGVTAARADDGRATRLVVSLLPDQPDAVVFNWEGPVAVPMAIEVRAAWLQWQSSGRKRIVLNLNSPGGNVQEGMRLISVLDEIKRTHALTTMVSHGRLCASMCIPIYLQGQIRIAASTSVWLFHEVTTADQSTGEVQGINPGLSEVLLTRYYRPAGIPDAWLAELRRITRGTDYWQTGQDLIASNSGIIHRTLPNIVDRGLPLNGIPRPAPSATAPLAPAI